MLKRLVSPLNIDTVIEQYNSVNDVPIDDLEIDFYKEPCIAWSLGDSVVYLRECPNHHEIIYLDSKEHPIDSLKLVSKIIEKYPVLRLRPLGDYFFGLLFITTMHSAMQYIRGRTYLVNIHYDADIAKHYIRYSNGL